MNNINETAIPQDMAENEQSLSQDISHEAQPASQALTADAAESEAPATDAAEPEAPTADAAEPEAPTADAAEPISQPTSNSKAPKKSKAKLLIGGGIVAILLVIIIIVVLLIVGVVGFMLIRSSQKSKAEAEALAAQISQVEALIYEIDVNQISDDEKDIYAAYDAYCALPEESRQEVINSDTLMSSYKQLESIIAERKARAAQVDELIAAIDYTNWFTEANSLKPAVIAYNQLEEKDKAYLTNEPALKEAYDYVTSNSVEVNESNFFEIFTIQYVVGENSNLGEGLSITQDGYTIDWDEKTITPDISIGTHNDYATPVTVYVQCKYPNLYSDCSFHINLHQTYTGIGLIDSDVHEFEYQSRDISYNSAMEIGQYIIYVENNAASGGLLDTFGLSVDWNDLVHEMNAFDVSRVEFTEISGTVSYN